MIQNGYHLPLPLSGIGQPRKKPDPRDWNMGLILEMNQRQNPRKPQNGLGRKEEEGSKRAGELDKN